MYSSGVAYVRSSRSSPFKIARAAAYLGMPRPSIKMSRRTRSGFEPCGLQGDVRTHRVPDEIEARCSERSRRFEHVMRVADRSVRASGCDVAVPAPPKIERNDVQAATGEPFAKTIERARHELTSEKMDPKWPRIIRGDCRSDVTGLRGLQIALLAPRRDRLPAPRQRRLGSQNRKPSLLLVLWS
jgi:hypothetical protein